MQTDKRFDLIVYVSIFIITIILFSANIGLNKNSLVYITFIFNGCYFYYHVISSKKNISLFRLFYIFNFIFFFIAPSMQYTAGIVFWHGNGLSVNYLDEDYIIANLVILFFCIILDITYWVHKVKKRDSLHNREVVFTYKKARALNCICVILLTFLILSGNLVSKSAGLSLSGNLGIQILNICRTIPVACLIYQVLLKEETGKYKLFMLIPLIVVLIVFFPFYGSVSRFLLFGTYLAIISLFFSDYEYKSLYPLLFLIGFGVVFSSFNFFKSNGIHDISSFSFSFVNFNHEDYDAYQLLMLTIKYVGKYGVCYGMNILSAVFSFVPRSIWNGKMLPSGAIFSGIFGSWFTNVSCPWIAEWYYAFGILGLFIGGIITGVLFKEIDNYSAEKWDYFGRGIYCVVTGLSIYIFRGSLLPSWSYTFATILSVAIVYIFVKKKKSSIAE